MANTTDLMIACFDEDNIILGISKKTGVFFEKVSNGGKSGGPKSLSIEAYGACYRSLGKERINEVIKAFKEADFQFPENAVLIIDDDNDVFSGVVPYLNIDD